MVEMDAGWLDFLGYWFAGFVRGIEDLDEPSRRVVLDRCGSACADSYTAEVFRDAKRDGADMESFLANLARRFPEAQYLLEGPKSIKVRYRRCGCDLVRLGLVKSPCFCECSVANLRANFGRALGVPVSVVLEASILGGAACCEFTVSLE